MSHVTSIGLDVHARSVSACAFDPFTGGGDAEGLRHRRRGDRRLDQGLRGPQGRVRERPDGLRPLQTGCASSASTAVVGAVSKMQRPAADRRRKNDRRDAAFLARLLATHNVVEVWVPPAEVEAARDLSRGLDDAREDLQRARQRLSKFLLRRGHVFDEVDALGRRRGAWTVAFWRWVRGLRPAEPAAAAAFDHYVACARCAESDKRALERRVAEVAATERWRPAVEASRA